MATNLKPLEFIPNVNSTASEWILWHKSLKSNYGIATANTIWLKAWGKRGSEDSDANTADLRDYISSQGITIEGGTWDFVADAFDNWSDFSAQAFSLGKYAALAVVIILIGFLAMLAWNVGKNPNGTINAVAAAKGGLI